MLHHCIALLPSLVHDYVHGSAAISPLKMKGLLPESQYSEHMW